MVTGRQYSNEYFESDGAKSFSDYCSLKWGRNPDAVFEVRALGGPDGGVYHGFFKNATALAAAVFPLEDSPRRVIPPDDVPRFGEIPYYITMNPIKEELFERSPNKMTRCGSGQGASDADVAAYNFFFIDFDTVRPGKVSATDQEKRAAAELADRVAEELNAEGMTPMLADSGNGYHLYCLLPASTGADIWRTAGQVKRVVGYLKNRFETPAVEIDASVTTPGHLIKLPGSLAMKGPNTPERPHRWSSFVLPETLPDAVDAFSLFVDELESSATAVPNAEPGAATLQWDSTVSGNFKLSFDHLVSVLDKSGLPYRVIDKSDKVILAFFECPHHSGNKDDKFECCLIVYKHDGHFGASCKHDPDATWHDFKKLIGFSPAKVSPEDIESQSQSDEVEIQTAPYRPLGVNRSICYYLIKATQQVIALQADRHTRGNLMMLAPLEYWKDNFGTINKNETVTVDWDSAVSYLIENSQAKGIYNNLRLRGRGVWTDNGCVVVHQGDILRCLTFGDDGITLIKDESVDPGDFSSGYLYERQPVWERSAPVQPLPVGMARGFLEIAKRFSWSNPTDGVLLAGWAVDAPISGILHWRPHIQMTGPAESGKTTVQSQFIVPCLGNTSLIVTSSTTEAGIRQALVRDAIPVNFDEGEAEDRQGIERMQKVIELARQASSDTSGMILKGSAGGESQGFYIRSCFCISAISVILNRKSDTSRFSILSLKVYNGIDRENNFRSLMHSITELITPDNCAALRERTVRLIPVILKNIGTFGRVVAELTQSRRSGDQLGTLLAGAYSLVSDGVATYGEALAWAQEQGFGNPARANRDLDEMQCLRRILEHQVPRHGVYPWDLGGTTIGELVGILIESAQYDEDTRRQKEKELDAIVDSFSEPAPEKDGTNAATPAQPTGQTKSLISPDHLETHRKVLARLGIRVIDEKMVVAVSDSHQGILRIMTGTQWESGGWSHFLRRLTGAVQEDSMRFAGVQNRATLIPFAVFEGA